MILTFDNDITGSGLIIGNDLVCINSSEFYTLNGLTGVEFTTWSVAPAGPQILSGQGTDSVELEFPSIGVYTITAIPENACGSSTPITFDVEVIGNDELLRPLLLVQSLRFYVKALRY